MCSGSTVYTALKNSGLRAGQWACFPGGGGGVGIQGVQLAATMGMRPIVVDTGAERKALAEEMGAEAFVDFKEVEDPTAEVVKITDGGAHGVFVTGEFALFVHALLNHGYICIDTNANRSGCSNSGLPNLFEICRWTTRGYHHVVRSDKTSFLLTSLLHHQFT